MQELKSRELDRVLRSAVTEYMRGGDWLQLGSPLVFGAFINHVKDRILAYIPDPQAASPSGGEQRR